MTARNEFSRCYNDAAGDHDLRVFAWRKWMDASIYIAQHIVNMARATRILSNAAPPQKRKDFEKMRNAALTVIHRLQESMGQLSDIDPEERKAEGRGRAIREVTLAAEGLRFESLPRTAKEYVKQSYFLHQKIDNADDTSPQPRPVPVPSASNPVEPTPSPSPAYTPLFDASRLKFVTSR